jgi:hypothetical protein
MNPQGPAPNPYAPPQAAVGVVPVPPVAYALPPPRVEGEARGATERVVTRPAGA